jgi:hypothetical protein
MNKYRIEIAIENIGMEGEIEDYVESSIFYVSENLYNEFKNLLESKVMVKGK